MPDLLHILKLAQGDIDDLWQRFANELSITYEENIPESRSMSRKYDTPRINEESKTALIKKCFSCFIYAGSTTYTNILSAAMMHTSNHALCGIYLVFIMEL
jgi:hypothetical protein